MLPRWFGQASYFKGEEEHSPPHPQSQVACLDHLASWETVQEYDLAFLSIL